uniref:Putative inactive leucine-rich repeat receptor-like protein kinase At3g03770 n=1 Tax=Anthurium amnicola TaxID=1678845 RepID=A0A1D1ZLW6_9ARAE
MAFSLAFLLVVLSWSDSIPGTQQLQSSQTQVLQQLRKHLEYPRQLDAWNYTGDLCSTPSSPVLTVTCEENSVTELKIVGGRPAKVRNFEGYPVMGQTLSQDFSVDSFVTTLARLTSLRGVILVSLGIWGPLPDKIHRLHSLEVLDLSSNFLYGSIPPKISAMGMLQSLTLDANFFNGTVPDWFDSLSNLTVLSLKNNHLQGPLPKSIGGVKALTSLAMPSNSISGRIPDLSRLTGLEVLDFRENQLDSELPTLPKGLVTILLSRNSLVGEIPQQFGELNQLQHLDLSYNLLQGIPPASLFSLPNISYLSLASNMLTGPLPRKLTCGSQLGFVDISTNRLTGALPSCLSSISNGRVIKFGGNCLSDDPSHQHGPSFCREANKEGKGRKSKDMGVLISVIGGAFIVVLLFLLVFLFLCRRHCQRAAADQRLLQKPVPDNSPTGFSSELLANASYVSQAVKLGTQVMPIYRVFSLEELNNATNNFIQSTYLGEGSFGKVYKGRLENGSYVAIKCLALFKKYSIRNLNLRLDLLSKLRHPHLVCLLGHCIDGSLDDSSANRVFLIYEYISHGSLHAHLSEINLEKILKWSDRLAVLIGIAKAIHFLHTGIIPGFFNNRLKTHNILLDEHYIAKVSDYGLSIITEEIVKHEAKTDGPKSSRAVQGKSPTLEMTNMEDDVYSFGLILLETLGGPALAEKGETFFLHEMRTSFSRQDERKNIIDPTVLGTSSEESLSLVISITNRCLSAESSNRPSIEDVLWNLQYAAQVQMTADGDQRSDVNSQA